jgi:hypothetical protein
MSATPFKVISDPDEINKMMNKNNLEAKRKDLENYVKCVAGSVEMLSGLTNISAIDGVALDPYACKVVGRDVLRAVMDEFVMIATNKPKINGKMNNWSTGGFGSIWMDMDAKKFGIDYIRVAFYSKKFQDEWEHNKPYSIQITCEKSK